MDSYITGTTIKRLREKRDLTQSELAYRLNVSAKTISKWETGRGYPDITLLDAISEELGVSVIELLSGNEIVNTNVSSNMLKSRFYVCPVCGNVITSSGEGVISCCGITLPELEPETVYLKKENTSLSDEVKNHLISIEKVEDELYVSLNHEQTKNHYISFIAAVTDGTVQIYKMFPEWNAECRIKPRHAKYIYVYCNHHGLFRFVT